MAKKKAARPQSGLLQSRLPDEQWEDVVSYCHEHDLSLSEAVRVAMVRLVKKAPTRPEREAATVPVGNPNLGEQSKAGAAARWKGKKKPAGG